MPKYNPRREEVAEKWNGVMIEAYDPFVGPHRVPGWECTRCGRRYGTSGPPPRNHICLMGATEKRGRVAR